MAKQQCWVLTEGHAGMVNQCLGLAERLDMPIVFKRVRIKAPWNYLPGQLWWRPLQPSQYVGDPLVPPWPDVVISSGRKSAVFSAAIRTASARKSFAVHVQHPLMNIKRFDLIAVPRHDGLTGTNVIVTKGALHRVTPAILQEAGERFRQRFAHLPRPLLAVLVGGSNSCYRITSEVTEHLASQLKAFCHRYNAGLVITPSRRTGAENEQILRTRLSGLPAYIWDGQGDNPYFGMLALADAIAVTSDSVSMVSEACSTGKPVYIIELDGGTRRFRRFHEGLRMDGITRPFTGDYDPWQYQPLDDTDRVADTTKAMLERRR